MLVLVMLAAATGVALWISGGALTVLFDSRARIGVLPSGAWLASFVTIGIAAAVALRRTRAAAVARSMLLIPLIAIVPWLPVPIPASMLIWTGPLRSWLWIVAAAGIAVPMLVRRLKPLAGGVLAAPQSAPSSAAAIAFALFLGAAWLAFPQLPAGDEPHYLVITQSLLSDHDLQIENNHRRGDYRSYFPGELRPDYLRRGTNGQIYSIHAPGLPLVVAPAFALFGHRGVIVFLALISAAATALVWIAAWRLTEDVRASWFGWAAVTLSAPWFFQSFGIFPDAMGAACLMLATLPLTRRDGPTDREAVVSGCALALLPWLHTRFSILAAIAGFILLRRCWIAGAPSPMRMVRLAALPALSGALWLLFFRVIYGAFNPAAPYGGYTQTALANMVRGIPGLLFDQQFGLLANAPVLLCAAAGLLPLWRRAPRLLLELAAILLPYVCAVAAYYMWWAGFSTPARFLVAVLLPLGVPAAVWFHTRRTESARLMGLGALTLTALISGTIAVSDRGALLFNTRDQPSRLLARLSPLVNLPAGFPSLFSQPPRAALVDAAIWIGGVVAVVALAQGVGRRVRSRGTLATAIALIAAAGACIVIETEWRLHGASPVTPTMANAVFARTIDADARQVGVRYQPFAITPVSRLTQGFTLARAAVGPNEPFLLAPGLAAGVYEVVAQGGDRPPTGRVSVQLDREFGAVWGWDLAARSPRTFTLATPVRAARVDLDAAARTTVTRLALTLVRVLRSSERLSDAEARHAARYGGSVVLLTGGGAFVEKGGTWVAGGDAAQFVIQPDEHTDIPLFLRNSLAVNVVTLESDGWHEVLRLQPGEERLTRVPVAPKRPGAQLRVSTTSGSRPSDTVPGSRDTRLLGVWIETR